MEVSRLLKNSYYTHCTDSHWRSRRNSEEIEQVSPRYVRRHENWFFSNLLGELGISCLQWQVSQQDLPRSASIPSLAISGSINKAASGSAHHKPKSAFMTRPISRMPDK
jgi:hypothetical protein